MAAKGTETALDERKGQRERERKRRKAPRPRNRLPVLFKLKIFNKLAR